MMMLCHNIILPSHTNPSLFVLNKTVIYLPLCSPTFSDLCAFNILSLPTTYETSIFTTLFTSRHLLPFNSRENVIGKNIYSCSCTSIFALESCRLLAPLVSCCKHTITQQASKHSLEQRVTREGWCKASPTSSDPLWLNYQHLEQLPGG